MPGPPQQPPPLDYFPVRPERPFWVAVGLAGLPHRASAWACFWVSVLLTVASVPAAFFYPIGIFGLGFGFAAWWYWACIQWVDEHNDWK
jgi:hypothetical protein